MLAGDRKALAHLAASINDLPTTGEYLYRLVEFLPSVPSLWFNGENIHGIRSPIECGNLAPQWASVYLAPQWASVFVSPLKVSL